MEIDRGSFILYIEVLSGSGNSPEHCGRYIGICDIRKLNKLEFGAVIVEDIVNRAVVRCYDVLLRRAQGRGSYRAAGCKDSAVGIRSAVEAGLSGIFGLFIFNAGRGSDRACNRSVHCDLVAAIAAELRPGCGVIVCPGPYGSREAVGVSDLFNVGEGASVELDGGGIYDGIRGVALFNARRGGLGVRSVVGANERSCGGGVI